MEAPNGILEVIQDGIAVALETPSPSLTGTETFDDLGVDSLGILMVLMHVAQQYGIEGTQDDIVELIYKTQTVEDLVNYVRQHIHPRSAA